MNILVAKRDLMNMNTTELNTLYKFYGICSKDGMSGDDKLWLLALKIHGSKSGQMNSEEDLMVAVYANDLDTIVELLDAGANVNTITDSGMTPLLATSNLEIIKVLLDRGANINVGDKDGRTALIFAALRGKLDLVNFLIERGANLDVIDDNGFSALFQAAARNHLEIVEALIKGGVNLDQQNNTGTTPLMVAIMQGHPKVARALIEAGADLDIKRKDGNTAVSLAKNKSGFLNMIKNTVDRKSASPEDMGYLYQYDLGSGAYGLVKLYLDISSGEMVAIKTIKKPLKPSRQKSLENELKSLMALSNRNEECADDIVCYYDYFMDENYYYIVMEYIPWFTMQNLIDNQAKISTIQKLEILHNICKALVYTHSKGIAHRDIKPENIMVDINEGPGGLYTGTRKAKLIDYGLSCIDTSDKRVLDSCKGYAGTLLYVAPELLKERGRIPGQYTKADVYSFGATMYYFLTGKQLYNDAKTNRQFMRMVEANPYPNVSFYITSIADLIDDILVYTPYERPEMKEVCERLEKIIKQLKGVQERARAQQLVPDTDTGSKFAKFKYRAPELM